MTDEHTLTFKGPIMRPFNPFVSQDDNINPALAPFRPACNESPTLPNGVSFSGTQRISRLSAGVSIAKAKQFKKVVDQVIETKQTPRLLMLLRVFIAVLMMFCTYSCFSRMAKMSWKYGRLFWMRNRYKFFVSFLITSRWFSWTSTTT